MESRVIRVPTRSSASRLPRFLQLSLILAGAWLQTAAVTPAAAQSAPVAQTELRAEIEALHAAMTEALRKEPASVSRFYTDDARIIGGGRALSGRAEVDADWAQASMFSDWSLEIIETGGTPSEPWVLGRSTLTSRSGRAMVTTYLGILQRGSDGALRYRIDMYTGAPGAGAVRTP